MISTESGVMAGTRRQTENGCSMTVLTEPDPFIYNDLAIAVALDRTFPGRESTRYNLLSVPGLKYLPKNPVLREQVTRDVLAAVDKNGAENLLIVTADHEHGPIVRRLKDEPRLRERLRTVRGYTAKARRVSTSLRTLTIACSNWRVHASGEFLPRFANAFGGGDTIGLMTVPGAAKSLREGDHRGRLVLDLLSPLIKKGLKAIVLVSHTDCGEYGGSAAFPDLGAERDRLLSDLGGAMAFIRGTYDIKVQRGMTHLTRDGELRVEPIAD